MNEGDNNTNNNNNANNQQLEGELHQLTQTLLNLNIQEQRIRRQSNQVERQIRDLQQEHRRRSTTTRRVVRRDRHGDIIDFGDYVNFLTTGKFRTRGGTITQISNVRFVSARDSTGRIINREPANVEIVRKYYEDHDRRRRL